MELCKQFKHIDAIHSLACLKENNHKGRHKYKANTGWFIDGKPVIYTEGYGILDTSKEVGTRLVHKVNNEITNK